MRVAIAGAGAVGRSIARELLENGHEVLLIDKNPSAIKVDSVPRAEWLLADACEISSLDDAGARALQRGRRRDRRRQGQPGRLAARQDRVRGAPGRRPGQPPGNEWLFNESWGVDVAVSTPRLLSALVEEAVSVGDLVRLMTLPAERGQPGRADPARRRAPGGPAGRLDRVAGRRRAGRHPARGPGARAAAAGPAAGRRRAVLRHVARTSSRSWRTSSPPSSAAPTSRRERERPPGISRNAGRTFLSSLRQVDRGWVGVSRSNARLGHLRAALERVRHGGEAVASCCVPAALLGAGLLLEGGRGLGRQPQLEQVARRHRLVAADHHDLAEHGLKRRRGRGSRGGAREQGAQEPARAVHADEPDRAHPAAGWPGSAGTCATARCRTGPRVPRPARPRRRSRRRSHRAPRPIARTAWARRTPAAGAR